MKTAMEATNDPSVVSIGNAGTPRLRNESNVTDVCDKQAEEGGLSSTGDMNYLSTLYLLDRRNQEAIILSNLGEIKHVSLSVCDKKDALLESLASSSIRSPASNLKKKLIILDLNGILMDIVSSPPQGCKADIRIGRRAVFRRSFCLDFLTFCFERFEVGVWSSRTKKNIDNVIDFLMGDLKHRLLFCWDASHCTSTQFKTLENKHKPLVFKDLRRIWKKQDPDLPWEKGFFDESNTLLIDDSPYKALLNPAHTAIFPCPYQCQSRNDNALGEGGEIRVYLERLLEAENVQKFVEQNPFGQKPITERTTTWSFYNKVLSTIHPLEATT